MKNTFKSLLLFAITVLFCIPVNAQNDINRKDEKGRKQGHWVKVDESKKKIYEGDFVDDIPAGKFTYFFDSGKPWSISVFSDKGTVTRTKMFDVSGNLTGEGKYINQKKDSTWKYYKEGKLISEENYINGVKTGIEKVYYPSGAIVEEKYWKNGQLDGPCKKYFESGVVRYDGKYVNGKVEGYTKFYYSTGKTYVEGLYVNDLKHGKWKYYKKDGIPDRVEEYINGRLQGEDPNVIPKEQVEKEIQNAKQLEPGNFHEEGY